MLFNNFDKSVYDLVKVIKNDGTRESKEFNVSTHRGINERDIYLAEIKNNKTVFSVEIIPAFRTTFNKKERVWCY